MKIIPKAQHGEVLTVQPDNTRVSKPIYLEKLPKRGPTFDEVVFTDPSTGKKGFIRVRKEYVSADTRSDYQKQKDQKKGEALYKKQEWEKKKQEAIQNGMALLHFTLPSTYVGPLFRKNGKSYIENMATQPGTGNTTVDATIDLLTPFLIGGTKSLITKQLPKRRIFQPTNLYKSSKPKNGTKPISKTIIPSSDQVYIVRSEKDLKGLKDFIQRKPQFDKFKSELDWSPKSYFEDAGGWSGYTQADIDALASHIPDYHMIERVAKENGTWLRMPDGSTWKGDARSWVQMQSKPFQNYVKNSPFKNQIFSHTTDARFDKFDIKYFGRTDEGFYGKGFYTHPAEVINGKLQGRNSYGDINYLLATNVERPLTLNNMNDFKWAGNFNRVGKTNTPEGTLEKYDAVYYGIPGETSVGASPSELVVPKPQNYKSIIGNNGNFDALDPNMYRIVIPFITGYSFLKNK